MKYLFIIAILTGIISSAFGAGDYTIMVPMRDEVRLATDIYLPDQDDGPWPLILIRTPNYKERYSVYGNYFSDHGYVVAIQDVRGQNESEGVFTLWMNDKEDGYDAVEWLAKYDPCNGIVGMFGGSYNGWATLAAATQKPPHLKCIAPVVSTGDPSIHHVYPFGVYALTQSLNVISLFKTRFGDKGEQYKLKKGFQHDISDLPLIDLDKKLFGEECDWWREFINHKPYDPYWEKSDVLDDLENIEIPVFVIGGWFDFGGIGTKMLYYHLSRSNMNNSKLIIGPWMHQTIGKRSSLGYDFGPEAEMDFTYEVLRWFDYHLKGEKNDIMQESRVKVFAVGANTWLEGDRYPLARSQDMKLYLNASGSLKYSAPGEDGVSRYTYDPLKPTPSIWHDNTTEHENLFAGMDDALFFVSDPFEQTVQVCGPIRAELFASTNGLDTDWFVYFMLVDESDELQGLGRGQIRARYRNGNEELLIPGMVNKYEIDLWHHSYMIEKGWKIKVMVCSAAWPHYSRNLNTGADNETTTEYRTAEQKVYHSENYPSSISFTTIPAQ